MSEKYAPLPSIEALNAIETAIRAAPPVDTAVMLVQRRAVHGDFTDDAGMAQGLKNLMRQGKNWEDLKPCQAECLEQIATKIGRILSGDPNYPDHWRDLQGYPRLVEERL